MWICVGWTAHQNEEISPAWGELTSLRRSHQPEENSPAWGELTSLRSPSLRRSQSGWAEGGPGWDLCRYRVAFWWKGSRNLGVKDGSKWGFVHWEEGENRFGGAGHLTSEDVDIEKRRVRTLLEERVIWPVRTCSRITTTKDWFIWWRGEAEARWIETKVYFNPRGGNSKRQTRDIRLNIAKIR